MIGIIGFGRFGELMATHLAKDFPVYVYNRSDKSRAIRQIGAKPASLEHACGQKIVIFATPISMFQEMLAKTSPLLPPQTLVIDVCSVKVEPIRWMTRLLPQTVSILATHPMFGPDSAAQTLAGCKIVLCKVRIASNRYHRIIDYLKTKQLIVIETTPDEHDRDIATSLSLTHFIGRALSAFGATKLDIDTEGYKRLLHILEVVENDTWQLFYDMHQYNPYAAQKREAFIAALNAIDAQLKQ